MSDERKRESTRDTTPPQANPYLAMPLARVRLDAINGVRLAVEAWRSRDPQGAGKELGHVIEPGAAGPEMNQDAGARKHE
jgi:hypothetical protein